MNKTTILELLNSQVENPNDITDEHVEVFIALHKGSVDPEHIHLFQNLDLKEPRVLFPGERTLNRNTFICHGKHANIKSKYIVVGSSPSLLGKKLGSIIDNYENIIRVNWYPTTNKFIDDIGSIEQIVAIKTTCGPGLDSKCNLNLGRDAYHKSKMHPDLVWVTSNTIKKVKRSGNLDYLQTCYNTTNYKAYGHVLKKFVKNNNISKGSFTGTQAIIIAYAITNKPVDIVGFCNTCITNYKHYYDNSDVSHVIKHNQKYEDSALIRLLQKGIVGRVLDI